MAFGLFAFTLKWFPWWLTAGVAGMAVLGNWLILHRIVGSRVSRHARGWDVGIVTYPLMVMLLIVVFRDHLAIAALAWMIMAFGDGLATLVGKALDGPRLPWNRTKSWSGLGAFLLGSAIGGFVIGEWMGWGRGLPIAIAILTAAVVESLPLGIDDNVTVPIAAAVPLLIFGYEPWHAYVIPDQWGWIVVNTVLAAIGYVARSVDLSGAVGGWVLGAIIILFAWWPMYVALLAFFAIGSGATKLGYRRKAAAGLAQEKGGRRSFSHAFSNVGVAAICALAWSRYSRSHWPIDESVIVYLMGIASLATAAADTTASEVGQLAGKRAFLPLTLRRVPTGTEGAISMEGTMAGLGGGFLVAVAGVVAFQRLFTRSQEIAWTAIALITAAALAGSYLESIAGSWNRKLTEPVPNGVLNFFNTAVGAVIFYYLARLEWITEYLRRL
jgi:uncharacterized protein (TIGR00297 family)